MSIETMLVRLEPHELDDRCRDVHCYSHHVDEPGSGYLACPECFHLYRTKRALRRAYRRTYWRVMRGNLALFVGDAWRMSWWRFFWRLATVRVDKIYSCPECSHDF